MPRSEGRNNIALLSESVFPFQDYHFPKSKAERFPSDNTALAALHVAHESTEYPRKVTIAHFVKGPSVRVITRYHKSPIKGERAINTSALLTNDTSNRHGLSDEPLSEWATYTRAKQAPAHDVHAAVVEPQLCPPGSAALLYMFVRVSHLPPRPRSRIHADGSSRNASGSFVLCVALRNIGLSYLGITRS